MRSDRRALAVLAVWLGGCSYAWDALRPFPDGGGNTPDDVVVVPPVDAGSPIDVFDANTTQDSASSDSVATNERGLDVLRDVLGDTLTLDGASPDAATIDGGFRDTEQVDAAGSDVPCSGATCPCSATAAAGWCPIGNACTSGACAPVALAGSLVITEIQNNPDAVADNVGEWFEVYNPGDSAVDVRNLHVHGSGSERFVVSASAPLVVASHGYVVFGTSGDRSTNGGVSEDFVYGTAMSLANSGTDTITLLAPDDTTVIHTVTYDTTTTSGWPAGKVAMSA